MLDDYPLDELVDRIDWTPFFQTWELAGHYPAILEDPVVGPAARSLFEDARELLDRIVRERLLTARGRVRLLPGRSGGRRHRGLPDERTGARPLATIHTLRQQMAKPPGRPNLALADFVAPRDSGVLDYVGAFAVTAGVGLDELVAEFEAAHDDYNAILAKALADRLAEAFAERLHERVRREFWGYARTEALDNDELIREAYQGIRPAPGYPACPDHTEKRHPVRPARRRAAGGHHADRELRHAAGGGGERLLLLAPRVAVLRRRQDRARPGRGLCPPEGDGRGEMERWLSPNLNYERKPLPLDAHPSRSDHRQRVHVLDGAMGTMLYSRGVFVNVCYDELNLTQPALVQEVHEAYVRAGAEILETNTFGANPVKLSAFGLDERTEEINRAAAALARRAARGRALVVGAIGPLGIRIEPWGPTARSEAVAHFAARREAWWRAGWTDSSWRPSATWTRSTPRSRRRRPPLRSCRSSPR